MKKILYLLLFTFSLSFSQNYVALDTTDYKQRTALLERIENQLDTIKKNNEKNYKGDLKFKINESYSEVFDKISNIVKNKEIIFHKYFSNYIDSITNTIIKKNKEIIKKNNIQSYVIRSNGLNAYSTGYNYVFLNMGLFKYLENESQLVSILCHEIAHDILEHSKQSILDSAKLETSEEKKEQTKSLSKQKYNKQSKAFSLLKDIIYKSQQKNRQHEIEADSLGFLLYKKTKYNPREFLTTLELMHQYDSSPNVELNKTLYKELFDLPNQPFKENWMKIEDFNSYNYNHYKENINKDSIKSHPEMLDRIDFIKNNFIEELKVKKEFSTDDTFKTLKNIAFHEDIINLFYAEEYGISLYLTLFKLKRDPDNKYFKKILAYNFLELSKAKKSYKLNRYLDRLNPKNQDNSYMQFLSFIWNLRLDEIDNIAKYYLE